MLTAFLIWGGAGIAQISLGQSRRLGYQKPFPAAGRSPMTDETQDKTDPVALAILAQLRAAAPKQLSPQQIATAFYQERRKPSDPPQGWRKYLPAVRQQALHLARQGRIEIVRKGELVDLQDFKGLVHLRLPEDHK